MKIPVEINYFAGGLRAMLKVILKFDNPHLFLPINAIIDTGSPTTLIGISDMRRMRLSKVQLNKIQGMTHEVNIGGGKVKTIKLENMKFKIGSYLDIEMDVQFPIDGEEKAQPSLLGVDFLEKINANFCFNPSKREAYLEIN
jgi:hypothetical protein